MFMPHLEHESLNSTVQTRVAGCWGQNAYKQEERAIKQHVF